MPMKITGHWPVRRPRLLDSEFELVPQPSPTPSDSLYGAGVKLTSTVEWTSTTVRSWQNDCDTFRKAGRDFELRHVTLTEHCRYVQLFASKHNLTFTMRGTTVRFILGGSD